MFETLIKQLSNITKVVTWLNLRRVMLLTGACLIGLTLLTLYEQRARLVSAVETRGVEVQSRPVKTSVLTVPVEVQAKIKSIVDNSGMIAAISVLNVDLRLNQRSTIFQYSDSPLIINAWDKFYREHGYTQPIFTTSDKNNSQMVSVIDGKFTCERYEDMLSVPMLSDARSAQPEICLISLPPYYGEFSGYIVFGLTKIPTQAERDEIMIMAKSLSNEIFLKNVVNR